MMRNLSRPCRAPNNDGRVTFSTFSQSSSGRVLPPLQTALPFSSPFEITLLFASLWFDPPLLLPPFFLLLLRLCSPFFDPTDLTFFFFFPFFGVELEALLLSSTFMLLAASLLPRSSGSLKKLNAQNGKRH